MEPENGKPERHEAQGDPAKLEQPVTEPKAEANAADEKKGTEAHTPAETVEAKAPQRSSEPVKTPPPAAVPAIVRPRSAGIDSRKLSGRSRRELLKVAPVLALGAFVVPSWQESLLRKGVAFSDWASAQLFRRGHFAPTFSDLELTPFEKFPINGYDVDDPGVIFENWTLTVTGAVQRPGDYKLEQIQKLPLHRQNTRHVCVEGWDVIGRFGGARLSEFLAMIGADTSARFVTVQCADDYYETLDMATALHPQTLLCWEMYERPLTREHGAPLRLQIPTKVGYKQAKYLTDLMVTNVVEKYGYWEDQGYSEFYGL